MASADLLGLGEVEHEDGGHGASAAVPSLDEDDEYQLALALSQSSAEADRAKRLSSINDEHRAHAAMVGGEELQLALALSQSLADHGPADGDLLGAHSTDLLGLLPEQYPADGHVGAASPLSSLPTTPAAAGPAEAVAAPAAVHAPPPQMAAAPKPAAFPPSSALGFDDLLTAALPSPALPALDSLFVCAPAAPPAAAPLAAIPSATAPSPGLDPFESLLLPATSTAGNAPGPVPLTTFPSDEFESLLQLAAPSAAAVTGPAAARSAAPPATSSLLD